MAFDNTSAALGPRTLTMVTKSGEEEPLSIRIEFTEIRRFEFDEDDFIDMPTGVVYIESDRITLTSDAVGDDQLNVAYRLMFLAGEYILKHSGELGLSVFKYEPGDVKDWHAYSRRCSPSRLTPHNTRAQPRRWLPVDQHG